MCVLPDWLTKPLLFSFIIEFVARPDPKQHLAFRCLKQNVVLTPYSYLVGLAFFLTSRNASRISRYPVLPVRQHY